MRKIIGLSCIIMGVVCLLASVGVAVYNHWENKNAKESSRLLLQSVQYAIEIEPSISDETNQEVSQEVNQEMDSEMPTITVDGYDCIGIIFIPVLELELPVFLDWSYEKMKIAPCHYYGSYISDNLVIAGHNYESHFGKIQQLQPQDLVIFTDAKGKIHEYEVVLLETLPPNATKEMISSGFALSLYTCTPDVSNRVTVRCKDVGVKT